MECFSDIEGFDLVRNVAAVAVDPAGDHDSVRWYLTRVQALNKQDLV